MDLMLEERNDILLTAVNVCVYVMQVEETIKNGMKNVIFITTFHKSYQIKY